MEIVIQFALIDQLWMIGVGGFDFDGNLEIGFSVNGLVDLSECTLVNFTDNFEVLTYLL